MKLTTSSLTWRTARLRLSSPTAPAGVRQARTEAARHRVTGVRSSAVIAGVVMLTGVAACSSHPSGTTAGGQPSQPAAASRTPGTGSGGPASASPAASGTSQPKRHVKVPKKDIITGLITFNGHYQFSGPVTSQGAFSAFPGVTTSKSSCSHIAQNGTPVPGGSSRQFIIPAPPQGGDITVVAAVQPYRGPGTYSKSAVMAVGASVVVNGASYNLQSPGAVETVTFSSDGSGQFTFRNAAAVGSAKPALSGTIRWTCSV